MDYKKYLELIENLESRIFCDFDSVRAFCMQKGFNASTLSRIFNGHQDISVSLYLRICASLNVLPPGSNIRKVPSTISLPDYLLISHDAVFYSCIDLLSEPTSVNALNKISEVKKNLEVKNEMQKTM